jgi:GxxExxY protein
MQLHEPSTRNDEQLAAVHVAQVISYLKAFDHSLGLLITFNVKLLRSGIRRVVFGRP